MWDRNNARNVRGDLIEGDVEEYKPCLYGKTCSLKIMCLVVYMLVVKCMHL